MKHNLTVKLMACLLVLMMLVSAVPVFFSFAEEAAYEENPEYLKAENGNLAIGATIITQYNPHHDPGNGWDYTLINDGSMNTIYIPGYELPSNGGYHPGVGERNGWDQEIFRVNHSEWIGYDFGAPKTFDTVMVWPSQDEKVGKSIGMPNAFAVDISNDGVNWVRVYVKYDYPIPTTFEPVVIHFPETTAQYVRFVGLSMNASTLNEFAMKICEFAVMDQNYVAQAETYCPNLAIGKPVTSSAYHAGMPAWGLEFINDGDPYNMCENFTDWGQFCGWHTNVGVPGNEDAWISYDLLTETEFDKVVLWPSTERFKNQQHDKVVNQGLFLPKSFTVQISDDGITWTDVKTLSEMPSVWEPIEVTFDMVSARYVRFFMPREQNLKLSEIEVFNTTVTETKGGDKTVVKPGVNVALNATPIYSNRTWAEGWYPHKMQNGILNDNGGLTTEIGAEHYVGYKFDAPTAVSKLVLYSAGSGAPEDDVWSGIPHSFDIEISNDGLNWTKIGDYTCEAPVRNEGLTVTFDTVVTRCIRIYSTDMYAKPSDLNGTRIQLAEMEVYCDSTLLTSGEDLFTPFYQVKENADTTKHDVRIVLVTNVEKLAKVDAATVTVTFDLAGGGTKTLTKALDGTEDGYSLFKTITAAGDTYSAADGYAIFGCAIVDIPDGAYTAINVTVVDGQGNTLLSTK